MKTALKVIAAGTVLAAFVPPMSAAQSVEPYPMFQCSDFLESAGVGGKPYQILDEKVCGDGVMSFEEVSEGFCNGIYEDLRSTAESSGWNNNRLQILDFVQEQACAEDNGPA